MFDSLKEAMNILSDSVVFTFSRSESSTSTSNRLCNALKICSSLHLSLAELLGDDSDSTAPNRLMLLNQPNWESHWVVEMKHNISFKPPFSINTNDNDNNDNNNGNNNNNNIKSTSSNNMSSSPNSSDSRPTLASSVRLEYQVPRKGIYLSASQSLAELSDFQGSCVLAKSATGEAQVFISLLKHIYVSA